MIALGVCDVCRSDVNQTESHCYRVVGWEQVRRVGGANSIVERERLGPIAHTSCVKQRAKRRARGINDEQQSLS